MRLFLAVNLTDALRAEVAALAAPLVQAAPGVRWVRPELLHLTIKFLGECADERVPAIAPAISRAVAGQRPFACQAGGVGAFPNFRRPRVVGMDMQPRAPFGKLAGRCEAVPETLGCAAARRPFRAHVTRARDART